jgi:hypothetical protein
VSDKVRKMMGFRIATLHGSERCGRFDGIWLVRSSVTFPLDEPGGHSQATVPLKRKGL